MNPGVEGSSPFGHPLNFKELVMKYTIAKVAGSFIVIAALTLAWFSYSSSQPTAYAQGEKAKQAKMTENFLAKKVKHLKVGESSPVSPEALIVDEDKNVWIQQHAVLLEGDTGITVKCEKDGFHVEITNLKLKWVELKLEKAQEEFLKPIVTVRIPVK